MPDPLDGFPVPDLAPQRINVDEYHMCTAEKLELLGGFLCEGPRPRLELLRLLLVNVGLAEAVTLAPEERWREALKRAYG
jgi:hypothetical protein